MKRTVYRLSFFALSIFLFSCMSARYYSIETQKPAEVTFPAAHPNIVVANNAAIQAEHVGLELKIGSKILENRSLPKDSAHWACLNFLTKELSDSHYFSDVLLYNYSLREDNDFLSIRSISPQKVDEIAGNVDADALISMDRLLFKVQQTIVGGVIPFCAIEVDYASDFSVYVPGKDRAIYTALLTDTILFSEFVDNDSSMIFQTLPTLLLMEAAKNIAYKVTASFTPGWAQTERVLYSSYDSQAKMAYAYAKKEKWEEAANIWQKMYATEKNNQKKGMMAINLAVSSEMQDNFPAALEWVKKAIASYTQTKPAKVKEESAFATKYQKILEERIIQNAALDQQLKR